MNDTKVEVQAQEVAEIKSEAIPQRNSKRTLMIIGLMVGLVAIAAIAFLLGKQSGQNTDQNKQTPTPTTQNVVNNDENDSVGVTGEVEATTSPKTKITLKTDKYDNGKKLGSSEAEYLVDEKCMKEYSSTIVDMKFSYDSCIWKVKEDGNLNSGGALSTIFLNYKDTDQNMQIQFYGVGMGGGYPSCGDSQEINLINGEIVKHAGMDSQIYFYFNKKTDFAIKGGTGANGDVNFVKYSEYYNMEDEYDFCYVTDLINTVPLLVTPSNEDEALNAAREFFLLTEMPNSKELLKEADRFAIQFFKDRE